ERGRGGYRPALAACLHDPRGGAGGRRGSGAAAGRDPAATLAAGRRRPGGTCQCRLDGADGHRTGARGRPGRVGIRRRRWRLPGGDPAARANAAWTELTDTARDLGFARRGSDTPRQAASRLIKDAKLRSRHQEPLLRLTNAVERARFARNPADDSALEEDLAAVRGGLG